VGDRLCQRSEAASFSVSCGLDAARHAGRTLAARSGILSLLTIGVSWLAHRALPSLASGLPLSLDYGWIGHSCQIMRLTDSIRAKLATGIVQRAYNTHPMLFWGGVCRHGPVPGMR
jgi:hypothetical protein